MPKTLRSPTFVASSHHRQRHTRCLASRITHRRARRFLPLYVSAPLICRVNPALVSLLPFYIANGPSTPSTFLFQLVDGQSATLGLPACTYALDTALLFPSNMNTERPLITSPSGIVAGYNTFVLFLFPFTHSFIAYLSLSHLLLLYKYLAPGLAERQAKLRPHPLPLVCDSLIV